MFFTLPTAFETTRSRSTSSFAGFISADNNSIQFLKTGDTKDIDKAVSFGRQGITANPEEAWANYGLGLALIYKRSMSDAGFYLRRALDLNPNDVTFLGIHALWLSYVGRGDEALATIKEAIRRDPYGQEWFWDIQGIVFTMQGMYPEAVSSFMNMRGLECWSRCNLAFCLMKSGDPVQAKFVLKEFRSRTADLSPSALMDIVLPDVNPEFRRDFLNTLRSIESS